MYTSNIGEFVDLFTQMCEYVGEQVTRLVSTRQSSAAADSKELIMTVVFLGGLHPDVVRR